MDLLLGGGAKFFDKAYRLDKRNLLKEFRDAGYVVMDKPAELAVAPTNKRWLGLFARSHLPYTVDHVRDPKLLSNVPTLATMTAAALRRLEGESRFILQVEGGRVDHGCHNNDAAAALYDQIAFDEAIDVALEYQKRDPETLIVITTDHGNGNLALNGNGDAYGQSTWQFRNLRDVKQSFATMLKPLKRQVDEPEIEKDEVADKKKEDAKSAAQKEREKTEKKIKEENVATPTEIIQIVEAGTGYKMPYRKAELLRLCLMNTGEAIYDMRKSDTAALGDVMANHLAVAFTGTAHTGDFVQVTAIGPARNASVAISRTPISSATTSTSLASISGTRRNRSLKRAATKPAMLRTSAATHRFEPSRPDHAIEERRHAQRLRVKVSHPARLVEQRRDAPPIHEVR